MAKVRPSAAYGKWHAERARLESALVSAKKAYSDAMFAAIAAEQSLERHNRYESDPVAWASGEPLDADRQLLAGFKKFVCLRCGSTGVSPDGSCTKCADEAGGSGAKNLVNIYQTV